MTTVTVSIVLHESAHDIAACLRAVTAQSRVPDDIVVFDNASLDGGLELAHATESGIRTLRSIANIGFAAGQNRAMEAAPADLHLVLNPDCQPAPTFIERAEIAMTAMPRVGSMTGRLLRFHPDSPDDEQPAVELVDDILDSTGMVALRNRRVLDRGADLPSLDRYPDRELVFGASGAAAVYRRAMLEDIAVDGQVFDEAFHTYREDVDVAWRAQLRGWDSLYEPGALARHRRRVTPGRRRTLPASINRRSIANRWRMMAKNETGEGLRRHWYAIAVRDFGTIGYCLFREQSSLTAIVDVFRDRARLRRWRRHIQGRRIVDPAEVADWFGGDESRPVSRIDATESAQ